MLQPVGLKPVIPILMVDRVDTAVRAAAALAEGGLDMIEVTLRMPHALAALAAIAKELPALRVGAAMVQSPSDVTAARNAGARFLSSPGLTASLAAAGIASGLPFYPGAATASEVMAARELGLAFLRFYPAMEIGGIGLLRAFAGVFGGIAFCPSGGITEATAPEFLALPNVPVVSGTWIASRDAINDGDWTGITQRARRAALLRA
jgi:2-dehydro-3-deoxyphosphogluconate aldolase/(4S)-4-hydroxy-2-oxoglutarate aldolase